MLKKNRRDEKYFNSTRGQIVTLLRTGLRTVEELAQALGITDNAVRAHLAALERDGLVRQNGSKRGIGKPAYTYELTAAAERLFPKAYDLVLNRLLGVLSRRSNPQELEELLREVGRNLASEQVPLGGDTRTRLKAATNLLNELGGMATLEENQGQFFIRGFDCPLAALVPDHPQVCQLAEALVSEYTGLQMKETCNQQEPARCSFQVLS